MRVDGTVLIAALSLASLPRPAPSAALVATAGAAAVRPSPPPQQRYLGSFAYTIAPTAPAYGQMWSADDWIATDAATGKEYAWQNIMFVTGNDTAFCEASKEVLRRTGTNLPMLFYFGGWRTDLPGAPSAAASWKVSTDRYTELRTSYHHLPAHPFGVYVGDEPDLARHPERQQLLSDGLDLIKTSFPTAITYLNMLYASLGCPGPNPGGPFLCNASTWSAFFYSYAN